MLTLPNAISLLRLLLVPVVVFALARGAYAVALASFVTAGLSDAADGYLARRLKQHTAFGALLDAAADKLLVVCTMGMLLLLGALPGWLVALLLGRDALVVLGALAERRLAGPAQIAPLAAGKLHVLVVFALLALVQARLAGIDQAAGWLPAAFALACATALASLVHYTLVFVRRTRSRP